jgi:predicted dehydrogenase
MKNMKIGILGAGDIASSFHLPAWQEIAKVEITGICDIDTNKAKVLANIYKCNFYSSLSDMVQNEELDILDICTPNTMHYEHIKQSLNYGLHTLVEKPFVSTAKQAQELIKLAHKKRKKMMCAQHARFRGDSIKAKEVISQGKLGKIYFIRAQSLQTNYAAVKKDTYVDSSLSGGGPLQDFGAHLLDLACWLSGFNQAKYVSGYAFRNIIQSAIPALKDKKRKVDVEDLFVGKVKFKNNCILSIETSFLLNAPKDTMRLEIFGDKGSLIWPELIYTSRTKSGTRSRELKEKKVVRASIGELTEFVECIQQNRKPKVSPQESLEVTKIIESLYRSSSEGKTICC